MKYVGRIPGKHEIARLSTLIKEYPTTRADAVRVARMWGFDTEVIFFLRLLPLDQQFLSRADLLLQTEKLAETIRHARETSTIALNF